MTRKSILICVLALTPLFALTGCTRVGSIVSSTQLPSQDVPLPASASPATADGLIGWPGAAGDAVRCARAIIGTTRAAPDDGDHTGATPESALEAGRKCLSWSGAQRGLALAREENDRRLYVLEVDGVLKQALILRHGPALKGDGTQNTVIRWWLESWARCDHAEIPEAVARERGLQLWSNAAGDRTRQSRMATDSGYELAGDHVWISQDRAYAYVGINDDAEAWRRAKQQIRCA